jgi:hypothetical protein
MATLILRLETDPVTKKKNVWVKYESDADALPAEHEEAHQKLVEALLAGGKVKPDELGTIHIERPGERAPATEAPAAEPEAPAAEREAKGNKG